jgi:phenylacetate-CoA ligase
VANIFDRIYADSPVWFQQIGINAYGLIWRQRRFGGNFKHYAKQFRERESFSLLEWQEYQTVQLRRLLLTAFNDVPYYQGIFQSLGIDRSQLQEFRLQNLSNLPILGKETVRSMAEKLLTKCIPVKALNQYYTSGTTGTPLAIYYSKDMDYQVQAAYEVRIRHWAGVNQQMSRAMIGGRLIVPQANAHPPFWRYNFVERQLYLSAFHISSTNISDYVQALNHFKPQYYVGYASSYYFLAQIIKELNLVVHRPIAVLTSSDKLTDEMRKVIQEVFQAPVFDGYSGLEACCQISECEHHYMHISPDVGIIELLDENGYPVVPGEVGEIVATGLLNFAQPLVRYRTGDMASLSDESCSCGRRMPLVRELYGRKEDTVLLSDGRRVASFYKVFQGISGIREAQVIQKDFINFEIIVVPDKNGFPILQQNLLLENIHSRYGNLSIEIKCVDEIERTRGGKFRAVISQINHSTYSKP